MNGIQNYINSLEEENKQLRALARDLARLIKDLFEALPQEFKELENVKRGLHVAEKIIEDVIKLDQENGSSVQAPRNCQ
jgi:septation ring formation regulator EzrA